MARLSYTRIVKFTALLCAGFIAAVSLEGVLSAADLDKTAPLEPGEARPGGAATTFKTPDRNAFSHFSANLTFAEQLDFKVGNAIFRRLWISAPASTQASDGLGPLYNARACQRCHIKDGRGHPPGGNHPDDNAISMFLRLSIPPQNAAERALLKSGEALVIAEPTYGTQLQDFALPDFAIEGHMRIDYDEVQVAFPDGHSATLRRPSYLIEDLGYGPLHPQTMISPRVAPPMIGLGLLELIPKRDILANADPDDQDKDGISGRSNRVWSQERDDLALGRFGWKAGEPSVSQQSAHALTGDIGVSNPLGPAHWGDCTEKQTHCRAGPHGDSPQYEDLEASSELMAPLFFYARNLAVPARRHPDDPTVLAGKRHFNEAGCAACHTPRHRTGASEKQPHLAGQVIWPYTDLLLHDMGDGLADGRPEGRATGTEWRTPPLWGIGLTAAVNGHTNFLHDGRARNLEEAILWHGGEAEAAKQNYMKLRRSEREALVAFLSSL